jgi:cardiolipin synthase
MTEWRVLTWPNLISFLRLLGVGLFLWLLLGVQADGWAVVVLAIGGTPTGSTGSWPAGWARSAGSASCWTRSWTGSTSWPP